MAKNCGGMWKRESRAGNKYFFVRVDLGALGTVELMAIENRYKEKDVQPDLVLLPFEGKAEADRRASAQRPTSSPSPPPPSSAPSGSSDVDDIPF